MNLLKQAITLTLTLSRAYVRLLALFVQRSLYWCLCVLLKICLRTDKERSELFEYYSTPWPFPLDVTQDED